MTDEEYVRSVWGSHAYQGEFGSHIRIGLSEPFNSWTAAAEFTRERLEQVRQLRAEIELVPQYTGEAMRFLYREGALHWDAGSLADNVIINVRRCRTGARLEAELARLTAGMKPEAIA